MGEESSVAPHIVALPFPASGHVLPMLHLSRALAASGFSVTLLHAQRFRNLLHDQTAHHHRIRLVPIPLSAPSDPSWDCMRERLHAWERLRSVVEALLHSLSPFDCILADSHLGWAQDVADSFGVPRVAFWVSSAAECQVYCHAHTLISAGKLPFKVPRNRSFCDAADNLIPGFPGKMPVYHRVSSRDEAEECPRIPGLPPLDRRDFPSFLQIEDASDIIFQYFLDQTKRLSEAYMVLYNSVSDLEASVLSSIRAQSINAHALGPLFLLKEKLNPSPKRELSSKEDHCLSWLDKQSPNSVLYVAFGSMVPLPQAQIRALAKGLEASQQVFLWALLDDTRSEQNDAFPAGFLERTKERGLVVGWAPQALLLGHPSVGGFLSHCGWNSFLESISEGVPLIGFPLWSDHALVCKLMVEEWQVGLRLEADGDGFMRSEDVEALVRELMNGPMGVQLTNKAREWSRVIKKALQSGGASWECFQMLVEKLSLRDARCL